MYRTQVFPAHDEKNTIADIHWHVVKTDTGITTDREEIAHLIAAAPDLYQALAEIDRWSRRQNIALPTSKVYAALAKARGES